MSYLFRKTAAHQWEKISKIVPSLLVQRKGGSVRTLQGAVVMVKSASPTTEEGASAAANLRTLAKVIAVDGQAASAADNANADGGHAASNANSGPPSHLKDDAPPSSSAGSERSVRLIHVSAS